jgi:hypothetical protein
MLNSRKCENMQFWPILSQYVSIYVGGLSKIMKTSVRIAQIHTVTDLINALPGSSSVNMVQHATVEEAVFSMSMVTSHNSRLQSRNVFSTVPTNVPIDWLDRDHVIWVSCDVCPFCGYVSKSSGQLRVSCRLEE